MTSFAHGHDSPHESLDVVFAEVAAATERINSAKTRIQNALTDDEVDAAITDFIEARADRKMWGRVHADFWRSLGEPDSPERTAPLAHVVCSEDVADRGCGNCGDCSCGCF